jgi:hypothetical protein
MKQFPDRATIAGETTFPAAIRLLYAIRAKKANIM